MLWRDMTQRSNNNNNNIFTKYTVFVGVKGNFKIHPENMKRFYTAVIKCDTESWNSMEKNEDAFKHKIFDISGGKTPTLFFHLVLFFCLLFFVSHFKTRFFVAANKLVQLIAIMSILIDIKFVYVRLQLTNRSVISNKPSDFQVDIKVLSPFLLSWEFINLCNCNLISTQFRFFKFQPIILIGVSIRTM